MNSADRIAELHAEGKPASVIMETVLAEEIAAERMARLVAKYPGLTAQMVYGMANVMRWERDGSAPSVHEQPITAEEWDLLDPPSGVGLSAEGL